MKNIIYTFLLLTLTFGINAQSRTVTNFSDEASGYNVYLYQSLIRMLNKDQNPEFNMLIRNLDHLKFMTDSKTPVETSDRNKVESLDKGIDNEGFETIVSVDNKDYMFHLYLLEKGGESNWVSTFLFQGMTGVMEMKGELDTKYLHAFQSLNYEQLGKMLSFDTEEAMENWD